jgi:hypothetical protein
MDLITVYETKYGKKKLSELIKISNKIHEYNSTRFEYSKLSYDVMLFYYNLVKEGEKKADDIKIECNPAMPNYQPSELDIKSLMKNLKIIEEEKLKQREGDAIKGIFVDKEAILFIDKEKKRRTKRKRGLNIINSI